MKQMFLCLTTKMASTLPTWEAAYALTRHWEPRFSMMANRGWSYVYLSRGKICVVCAGIITEIKATI